MRYETNDIQIYFFHRWMPNIWNTILIVCCHGKNSTHISVNILYICAGRVAPWKCVSICPFVYHNNRCYDTLQYYCCRCDVSTYRFSHAYDKKNIAKLKILIGRWSEMLRFACSSPVIHSQFKQTKATEKVTKTQSIYPTRKSNRFRWIYTMHQWQKPEFS